MKDTLLVRGLIIVVLIVGVIFLLKSKDDVSESADLNIATTTDQAGITPSSKTTTKTEPISGMKTSLGGIFAEKGSYQCDYEQVTQQQRSSNVIYISDGKMRGEFRTSTANGTTANILVYDGTYMYLWAEGQSTGKISEPKTLADLPGIIPEDVSSGRILGSGVNSVSWLCHAWSKDSSKLTKPSYVKFY